MKQSRIKQLLLTWGVWLVYTGIVVFLVSRHEPWGDEYHVWNMAYNLSFKEIWCAMRYEGHFCLWHYLVAIWVKLFSMDYHALYLVSVPLMSLSVWIILFKIRFPYIAKLFIILSAPCLFWMPVISRCYALIPPVLAGIVYSYQNHKPLLFCICLGLLANTHAYMEGMVGILWILFVKYEVISKWKKDRKNAKKNLYFSIFTIVFVVVAFLQIVGSIMDAANEINPAYSKIDTLTTWCNSFYQYHKINLFSIIQSHFISGFPNIDIYITFFLYLAFLVLLILWYKRITPDKRLPLFYVVSVSVLWQFLFAIKVYYMDWQRVYLLLIPIIVIIAALYKSKRQNTIINCLCLVLLLLNTACQYKPVLDIFQENNTSLRVSNEISRAIPEGKVVYSLCGHFNKCEVMKREVRIIDSFDDIIFVDVENCEYLISYSDQLDVMPSSGITLNWLDIRCMPVTRLIINSKNINVEHVSVIDNVFHVYKVSRDYSI